MELSDSLIVPCPIKGCKGQIQLSKLLEYVKIVHAGDYQGKCELHKKVVFVRLEYTIM